MDIIGLWDPTVNLQRRLGDDDHPYEELFQRNPMPALRFVRVLVSTGCVFGLITFLWSIMTTFFNDGSYGECDNWISTYVAIQIGVQTIQSPIRASMGYIVYGDVKLNGVPVSPAQRMSLLIRSSAWRFNKSAAMVVYLNFFSGALTLFMRYKCSHDSGIFFNCAMGVTVMFVIRWIGTFGLLCYYFGPQGAPSGASDEMISALGVSTFEQQIGEEPVTCPICIDEMNDGDRVRELPCTPRPHIYHQRCIDPWLKINKSCPLCTRRIDESGEDEKEKEE